MGLLIKLVLSRSETSPGDLEPSIRAELNGDFWCFFRSFLVNCSNSFHFKRMSSSYYFDLVLDSSSKNIPSKNKSIVSENSSLRLSILEKSSAELSVNLCRNYRISPPISQTTETAENRHLKLSQERLRNLPHYS